MVGLHTKIDFLLCNHGTLLTLIVYEGAVENVATEFSRSKRDSSYCPVPCQQAHDPDIRYHTTSKSKWLT